MADPVHEIDDAGGADEGIPAPVITAALFSRFASRDNDDVANKVLSAMRKQFGGHQEPGKH